MKRIRSPFEAMNAEEFEIWLKMLAYDRRYFSDMRYEKREFMSRFGKIYRQEKNGTWKMFYEGSGILGKASGYTERWIIRLVDKIWGGAIGKCVKKDKAVKIIKGQNRSELKMTLLHELIHVYETFFEKEKGCKQYEQWLLIYFYESLKKRIGQEVLKEILDADLHFVTAHGFVINVSFHSLLFLFKSLDLDIRLKKPFGTIYSYGRVKLFEKQHDKLQRKKRKGG